MENLQDQLIETPHCNYNGKADRSTYPEYLLPYYDAVALHGNDFDSLLFFGQDAQRRRFEVFGATVPLAGRVVADMGCGHADFLAWMKENKIAYGAYIGVEALEVFIPNCTDTVAETDCKNAWILHDDFVANPKCFSQLVSLHRIDTILLSGSLNTMTKPVAMSVLNNAWKAIDSKPGAVLAFNFLPQIENHAPAPSFLPTPRLGALGMMQWALDQTPLVTYCQYYLGGHDATIVMIVPPKGGR